MMKYTFLLQLTFFFLLLSSCSTTSNKRMSITKIDSVHNYYLIYASKDGNIYKIVSQKVQKSEYVKKIAMGGKYRFEVFPVIDKSSGFAPSNYLDVKCLAFTDSTKICIEEGCLPNLYYSNDIEGLYTNK